MSENPKSTGDKGGNRHTNTDNWRYQMYDDQHTRPKIPFEGVVHRGSIHHVEMILKQRCNRPYELVAKRVLLVYEPDRQR